MPASEAAIGGALFAVVARPGIDQRLQRLGPQHDDGAMFEPHPVARCPGSQLLVDAFPRHADHLADFLLGDRDGAALRFKLVFFGEPKQCAGQTARQVLEDDLFDLVAGPAQPRAQQFDKLHRERRLAAHKGNEFATIDDEKFAVGIGGAIGRSWLPASVLYAWRSGRADRMLRAQDRRNTDACAEPTICWMQPAERHQLFRPQARRSPPSEICLSSAQIGCRGEPGAPVRSACGTYTFAGGPQQERPRTNPGLSNNCSQEVSTIALQFSISATGSRVSDQVRTISNERHLMCLV